MAYKNNGTANFNFFLNRQGPRGPQGIQGPQGFSPIVSVEEDVGNTFTLRVTNQDSSFVTSNLREHKEDRGGDYVRYDREGQLMYFGDPDFATTLKAGVIRLSTVEDLANASEEVALTPKIYKDDITTRVQEINQRIDSTNTNVTQVDNRVTTLDNSTVKLTGNQTIEGTKTFLSKVRTQGIELSGDNIIQMDASNITIGGENTNRIDLTSNRGATLNNKNILTEASIPSSTTQPLKMENGLVTVQVDNQTIQVQDGKLHANLDELGNEVNSIAGDVAALQADLLGKQAKLTAGENITISADNVISSSASVPENVVTTDGSQKITGNKTFQRVIIDSTAGRLLTNNIYDADNVLILKRYLDGISVGHSSHKDSSLNAQGGFKLKLYNDQGTGTNEGYILAQNTVTAGANVTITKTTEGIKISATGGGTGTGDVTLAGDNSFTGNNTFDGETTFNGHTWTAEQEAVTLNVSSNTTLKNAYVTGTLSSLGELTAVSISAAGIKNNQNDKYYLNQGSITAGDNITIEETTDGVKISSTGGGSTPTNMVTTDTEQTITGNKNFTAFTTTFNHIKASGQVDAASIRLTSEFSTARLTTSISANAAYFDLFNGTDSAEIGVDGTRDSTYIQPPFGSTNLYINNYADNSSKSGIASNVVISGNIKNKVDNVTTYLLSQETVTAGDNVTIEKTEKGIKISSTGGSSSTLPVATKTTLGGVIVGDGLTVLEDGTLSTQVTGAQLEALQTLITDLSTKIDNLTNRVKALEETIDGGIA